MNRQRLIEQLKQATPIIAPSMLKCDFGNMHRELSLLEAAGAPVLHLDVMDGHFVPNLTYGPVVIESMRRLTDLPFDAHLMISNPQRYLDDYLRAGCDCITFHIEAVPEPVDLLRQIRESDALAGISLNPGTPWETIEPIIPECDMILVMSVEPGFGGQSFIPSSLEKLRRIRERMTPGTLLAVDGGIGPETIESTAEAGANFFVVGSAIFETPDYSDAIADLTNRAQLKTASSS